MDEKEPIKLEASLIEENAYSGFTSHHLSWQPPQ